MAKPFRLEMIFIALILLLITIKIIKNGKVSIRYSMVWFFSSLLILFFALFPGILGFVANVFGFETISNLVFLIVIGLLILISMSLTIIVSNQNRKLTILNQELSILKSEKRD